MTTVAELNAALAAAGFRGEVSKAEGVYYLVGEDFINCADTCLHAVNLSQLSIEAVIAEAQRLTLEAREQDAD